MSNENIIISDKYIIQGSKIFYLCESGGDEESVFNMEFLASLPDIENPKLQKEYMCGPFSLSGSDYFMCMFYYKSECNSKSGCFKQKIY